jgi:L-threonylcarbamoyladenylate synthase
MRVRINADDSNKIRSVGEIVRKGGIIVYPTDTLYGIGGDPLNPSAVSRILEIKEREGKPMPVLVSSFAAAAELVEINGIARALIDAFWPGGLTIVLEGKKTIPKSLMMGKRRLGVRMPNHWLTLRIIEACGGRLIGTSANISGMPAAKSLNELDSRVEAAVDAVIDGGAAPLGVPSTVVEVGPGVEGDQQVKEIYEDVRILREGAINAEVIRSELLKKAKGEGFAGF